MTKIEAASLLVELYAIYYRNNGLKEYYEEAVAMAIMALERNKDDKE